MRLRVLDLFCGAGGAALGYHYAGFDVVGVDLSPQKSYPFPLVRDDAIYYIKKYGHLFDVLHASPPCQAHTQLSTLHNAKPHLDLIPATREALIASGKPYVIENVEGAPLIHPIVLCGTMFDLHTGDAELRRHRLFETNFPVAQPLCEHGRRSAVIGVYGGHARNRVRRPESHARGVADFSLAQAREAMGVDRYNFMELSQMIPPMFTKYLGDFLWQHLAVPSQLFSQTR